MPGADGHHALAFNVHLSSAKLVRQSGDPRGRGWFDPHPAGCQAALHGKKLIIADGDDLAARLFGGFQRLLAARRATDADGGGHGLRVVDRVPQDERGRTGGLDTQDARQPGAVQVIELAEAHPVGGDVTGIAHRQA